MNAALLEEIGLTKGEIAVYLAMLELGSATVRPIVDKAKISYSKIYDILERLIQKGLVGYVIKENKRYFEAAPVERILEYMEDKEKQVNRQKEELKELLPQLKLKQQLSGFKSKSTIYKGIKGLQTAFLSSLNLLSKNDEILIIASQQESSTINIFFNKFVKEVKKRKIKMKVLANEHNSQINWLQVKQTHHIVPSTIAIFKNRVIVFPNSREITLFVIDNQEVAKSFKVQFRSWWNQRVRTYQGINQLRELWLEKLNFGDYCGFGEGTKIVKVLGERFFIKWQKEKTKYNIKGKVLIPKQYKNSVTVKKSIAEFRFTSEYENPGVTEVFKDKIIVVNFSDEPVAFVIEDKDVARSHQTYFDLLWKQARK